MKNLVEYKAEELIGECIFLYELEPKLVANKFYRRTARFQCKCGNEFEALISDVKRKHTRSCGCLYDKARKIAGKANKTHGLRSNPLYNVWKNMKARCLNPKTKFYEYYGGRGITICERWLDITNFVEDMYPTYEKGLQLDRINNDGNYEPSNCRWATRTENVNNVRRNIRIEYNGETKTLGQWATHFNILYSTLAYRIKQDWPIEKAFNTTVKEINYGNQYKKVS